MTDYLREHRREQHEAREYDRERCELHGPLRNDALLAEILALPKRERTARGLWRVGFTSLAAMEERS